MQKLLLILLCLPMIGFGQDTLRTKDIRFKGRADYRIAYNKYPFGEDGSLFSGFGYKINPKTAFSSSPEVIFQGNWLYGLKTGVHKKYFNSSASSFNWIEEEKHYEMINDEAVDKQEKYSQSKRTDQEFNLYYLKKKVRYYSSRTTEIEGTKESVDLYSRVSGATKRSGLRQRWHPNGQLKSETDQGNREDGRGATGLHREWYKNGQLEIEGMYEERTYTDKDNARIGLWKTWYENGQLASEGNYVKIWSLRCCPGKEDGLWKYWDENGQLQSESNYIKEADAAAIAQNPDAKDVYVFTSIRKEWYENGQLKTEGHYKNDCVTGLWRGYDSKGQLIWEYNYAWIYGDKSSGIINFDKSHHKHNKDGLCREWTKNGVLIKEINWSNNKENGLYREWYKNGQLEIEGMYDGSNEERFSSKIGLWKTWHENGQLRTEGNYVNGKKVGIHRSWNRDGEINSEKDHTRSPKFHK